jgi:serine/threonine-protein kinase RIO1
MADVEYDTIPVRLPSGTKAFIRLPRPFTLKDGIHLMNFLGGYIEEVAPKDDAAPLSKQEEANAD